MSNNIAMANGAMVIIEVKFTTERPVYYTVRV